jgi:hypothetical protein
MPKKNKQTETEMTEIENTNDVEVVESKTDNTEIILDGDNVECVFQVEIIEKTLYRFTANTRKEALAMVKDMSFITVSSVVECSERIKTNSLEQIGYRLKKE